MNKRLMGTEGEDKGNSGVPKTEICYKVTVNLCQSFTSAFETIPNLYSVDPVTPEGWLMYSRDGSRYEDIFDVY
jgi:hypothetical protein